MDDDAQKTKRTKRTRKKKENSNAPALVLRAGTALILSTSVLGGQVLRSTSMKAAAAMWCGTSMSLEGRPKARFGGRGTTASMASRENKRNEQKTGARGKKKKKMKNKKSKRPPGAQQAYSFFHDVADRQHDNKEGPAGARLSSFYFGERLGLLLGRYSFGRLVAFPGGQMADGATQGLGRGQANPRC